VQGMYFVFCILYLDYVMLNIITRIHGFNIIYMLSHELGMMNCWLFLSIKKKMTLGMNQNVIF